MAMEDLDGCNLGNIEAKEKEDARSSMEILNIVDLDMAYSSEKLVNLGNLFMTVMTKQDEVEEGMAVENDDSPDFLEKALTLHHLNAFLNAELRQLDDFVSNIYDLILGARQNIYSCVELSEPDSMAEIKLHDSEESLGQLKDQILKMKMQLANPLLIGSLFSNQDEWRHGSIAEQKRALRMLEKSLAREVDLEKRITGMKQNEDDLEMKLMLREQVAFHMEEAAEVIWGRFLEAENTVEVLMGISKEMGGRLQAMNFNLKASLQREHETHLKFETCTDHSNTKDITIQKLNQRIAQLNVENSQVLSLQENIKKLEQNLSGSESQLMRANAKIEANEEQIKEMESEIETLKEEVDQWESRAESAEEKVTHLTDTNLELSEELSFLKDSNESSTKKATILEKQLRELELQLQHSKASSEASQEQQNMLYSAIWDMEILIDELKQKVSKADSKTDDAEEQCIILSEANFELNKEIDILRARVEDLEASLNRANVEKIVSAKDINIKTNFIMDLVMQLAIERERVQKQLCSLTKENKLLIKRLQMTKEHASATSLESRGAEAPLTGSFAGATCAETSPEVPIESSFRSSEVEELPDDEPNNQSGNGLSPFSANHHGEYTVLEQKKTVGKSRRYIFIAILVLLLSVLASVLYDRRYSFGNIGG